MTDEAVELIAGKAGGLRKGEHPRSMFGGHPFVWI